MSEPGQAGFVYDGSTGELVDAADTAPCWEPHQMERRRAATIGALEALRSWLGD